MFSHWQADRFPIFPECTRFDSSTHYKGITPILNQNHRNSSFKIRDLSGHNNLNDNDYHFITSTRI